MNSDTPVRIPFSRSLSGRLLLLLLGLTALPALLIGGLAYRNARQTIEDRVVAQLTSVADLKQEQIATWLENRVADSRLLADNFLNEEHFTFILDPDSDPEQSAAFAAFLTDNLLSIQKARDGYSEIFFADAAGKVILSTDASRVGASAADYAAVGLTLASPTGETIEDIHREAGSGQIEMAFGHTLHKVDLNTNTVLPETNGVVVIRVRMDETIYPIIGEWPGMGGTGETLLVRAEGNSTVFLNPLRFDKNAALNLRAPFGAPNGKPAQLATAGQEGVIETPDYRGVPVLAAYRVIPITGWGFVAKQDVAESFAPVAELTRQVIGVTVVVLLAALLAAALLARALTRPLARLVGAARSVAAGEFEDDLPLHRSDEIGHLASAFQTMIAAVREREAELKTHAEELRLLNDLGQEMAATLDLRQIAGRVVAHVAGRFDDFLSGLLLYDAAREELVAYAAAGRGAPLITPGERTPAGRGLIGQAALTRRTQVSGDPAARAHFVPLPGLDARAEVAIPILREDELLGVLVVSSDRQDVFRPDDIVLLETLAAQLGPAIDNARLFRDLSASYDHTLDALVAALDARDKETEGHSRRVVVYTMALARQLGVSGGEKELAVLRRGALLHDIGKIGVPDSILLKPGPLIDEERAVMRRHPEWGQRILSGIPFLAGAADIVCAHQERWDGQGYPRGLQGETIPLGARIFAIADTFDAITSDRPYRAARPYATARAEIEAGRGTQFDPRAVEAFLRIPADDWARLRDEAKPSPVAAGPLPLWAEPPAELAALNRLIAAVSGSLDLDNILREAARTTVETLGAAAAGLFLYESETDTLSLAADYSLPETLKARFARFPVTGFHNEAVVREARNRVHANVAEVPAFVELGLPSAKPDWGEYLCVPLTAKGEVNGIMGIFNHRRHTFDDHDVSLYRAIGEQIGLAIANARLYESVEHLAITDGLTGAFNRRYLDEFLAKELQRCARYQRGVSLIVLDIDHFKEYNDAYGHPAGDEALRQVVGLLRQNVRAVDIVARYGGEEFAVVLPETEAVGAQAAAEKIRAAIQAHEFQHGHLTASLGGAHCATADDLSAEALIARADQALYNAKRRGRNCACTWEEELAALPRQTA